MTSVRVDQDSTVRRRSGDVRPSEPFTALTQLRKTDLLGPYNTTVHEPLPREIKEFAHESRGAIRLARPHPRHAKHN